MIRHAITVSELRLFDEPDPAPMADYDACCLLVWETPAIVLQPDGSYTTSVPDLACWCLRPDATSGPARARG